MDNVPMRTDAAEETAKKPPNQIDLRVGGRARMRRKMLGMSQGKLAEALGLTYQQVQKYEKGTNRIGASRLQHLARILDVQVAFFFEDASDQQELTANAAPITYVSEFLALPGGYALISAFGRLKSAKSRRRIVDLLKSIADDNN